MMLTQSNINPYLWAVGADITQLSTGDLVNNRYKLITHQIWQDTQPEQPTCLLRRLPDSVISYLKLFSYRWHLPVVYGVCRLENSAIILLENIPLDNRGNLYPTLEQVWLKSSPLQQVYWLWQILQLWQCLTEAGVSLSLLQPDNIRVEGWRIRLLQLYPGTASEEQLGKSWISFAQLAHPVIAGNLKDIVADLHAENVSLEAIAFSLNQLLLIQASQQPLSLQIASATDVGTKSTDNEDSYYPTNPENELASDLMIVCDGLGGHSQGEVASYLVVESLKLQIQVFLAEINKEREILSPDIIKEQLATIVRVSNNLIYARNQLQKRLSTRRIGTTLVMALQLPQMVFNANSHEVYLVNVGNSRAYWLTLNSCQELTVDDDVATQEVLLGKKLYRQALQSPYGGKLTQALGIKDGEDLSLRIERFILSEDGILLLCSDGLSDYGFLGKNWQKFAKESMTGQVSLENAVKSLLALARIENGHDNISLVATLYRVSPQDSVVVNLRDVYPQEGLVIPDSSSLVWAAFSRVTPNSSREQIPYLAAENLESGWWKWLQSRLFLGLLLIVALTGWLLFGWINLRPFSDIPLQQNPSAKDTPMQK